MTVLPSRSTARVPHSRSCALEEMRPVTAGGYPGGHCSREPLEVRQIPVLLKYAQRFGPRPSEPRRPLPLAMAGRAKIGVTPEQFQNILREPDI